MSNHTKGPWTIRGPSRPTLDSPDGGDYAILDGEGQIIAETFFRTDVHTTRPSRANAVLISKAPQLFAELKRCIVLIDGEVPATAIALLDEIESHSIKPAAAWPFPSKKEKPNG